MFFLSGYNKKKLIRMASSFALLLLLVVGRLGAASDTCGICTFRFGCTDRFSCNYDEEADAPDPAFALCDYGPDINHDRVCDQFQTFADIICIEAGTEMVGRTGPLLAGSVKAGDEIRKATGGFTTVHAVEVYNQTHHPLRIEAGACGNPGPVTVTEDHAVRCDGAWVRALDVGTHDHVPAFVQYVAIHTQDYCEDQLLTHSGLVVEGWDGRPKSAWRPHAYDDDGRRVRCANPGTWRELLFWAADWVVDQVSGG